MGQTQIREVQWKHSVAAAALKIKEEDMAKELGQPAEAAKGKENRLSHKESRKRTKGCQDIPF